VLLTAGGAYKHGNTDPFGPGKYAEGYAVLAQDLWVNGLRETIEREIDNGCRSITIAGHSLGAAVGQLLAVAIEVGTYIQTCSTCGYQAQTAHASNTTTTTTTKLGQGHA
jgi:hypothetical protein